MSSVPAERTALEAAGAVVTDTSLTLVDPDVSWEDYERLGIFLGQLHKSCEWWVADLIIAGEELFGHRFAQIDVALGLAPSTISNRVSVAKRIPPNRRRASLTLSHHADVAYLEPRERELWLDRCERGEWTRSRLREELHKAKELESGQMDDLVVTGPSAQDDLRDDSLVLSAEKEVRFKEIIAAKSAIDVHVCPACGHSWED